MNIDAWLSGEEGTRVVDAMARALYEGTRGKIRNPQSWITVDGEMRREWRRRATVALCAALSLTTTETCQVCGGVGEVTTTKGATSKILGRVIPCPNPDCKGGTVPGEPALLSALVERVQVSGDWVLRPADEHTDGIPLYVARPLEKEDET